MTVTPQFFGKRIHDSHEGVEIVETFKVTGLSGNVNAFKDPPMPQRGQLHPDQVRYPGAVVEGVALVQRINRDTCLAAAIYRRRAYQGGPRRITEASGQPPELVTVPVWQRRGSGPTAEVFLNPRFVWKRAHILRVERRVLAGDQVSAVQQAVCRSVGGWYEIDSDHYTLSGDTTATYDGLSTTIVAYKFETWARFPAVPVNDAVLKNVVAIPALGNLEAWAPPTMDENTGQPIIQVMPHTLFASQGLALPGF